MIARFLSNPFFRFLIFGTLAYLAWVLLYEFYLEPHTHLNRWIIDKIVRHSESLMSFFGVESAEFDDGQYRKRLGVMGSTGVTIGAPCNGLVLFALFVIFVLAFPGRWKHKLWFLPVGIIGIHVMNCLRVIALAVIFDYNPDWLEFNHDYTFTIVVYSFVFLLWYIYVNRLGILPANKNAASTSS